MPSEAESAVMAYFHARRSLSKQRVRPEVERLRAALIARLDRERLEDEAARSLWEAGLE